MESLMVQKKEGMWRKERMGESAWFVKTKSESDFYFDLQVGSRRQRLNRGDQLQSGPQKEVCSSHIKTSTYNMAYCLYHSVVTGSGTTITDAP